MTEAKQYLTSNKEHFLPSLPFVCVKRRSGTVNTTRLQLMNDSAST